jgi:hypothetical protein
VSRSDYPLWVKASTWGIPGRSGLWAFVAFSLATSVLLLVHGIRTGRLLEVAALLAVAALPYWLSIRWIDEHGSWDDDR